MNEKATFNHSFVLYLDHEVKKYHLKIEQTLSGPDGAENILLIESTVKIAMKPYHETSVICILSLSPPIINGKGEDDYEKWYWIFARLYLLNDGLQIYVGKYGNFQSVINKKQILENWEKVKKDISKLYLMDEVDPFIKNADNEFEQHFDLLFATDVFLNWLFNDIFRSYTWGEKITSPKSIGKHFGYITLKVDQRKWLEDLDKEKKIARIAFETIWKTDNMNMGAINEYLASVAPDACGHDLDYGFSCEGFYLMDISEKPFIRNAEMIMNGTMGDFYSRTDHYTLTKIEDE